MRKKTLIKIGESTFPDKCATCAFEISYNRSKEEINSQFDELSILKKYKLSILPHRVMEIGNVERTYYGRFCSLGRNKTWGPHNKHKKCRDRQINLPSTEMSLSDYFSIHQSEVSRRVGSKISTIGIVITFLALILSFLNIYVLICW